MKRLLGIAVLTCLVAAPSVAQAQRRGRGGPAMSVDGPVFNPTQTPEWRQAGGNLMVYQQIMEQKMMVAQQKQMQQNYQAMVKQQQAYDKWIKDQKAKKEKGKPVDPAFQQMLDQEAQFKAAQEARAARIAAKKAKTTKVRSATPVAETPTAEAKK